MGPLLTINADGGKNVHLITAEEILLAQICTNRGVISSKKYAGQRIRTPSDLLKRWWAQ